MTTNEMRILIYMNQVERPMARKVRNASVPDP